MEDGTKMVQNQDGKTKMVQPQKKVWIKALRPIYLPQEKKWSGDAQLLPEGQVAEVEEKCAKDLCGYNFKNSYPFEGERSGSDAQLGKLVRAVRISADEAKEILSKLPQHEEE